MICEASMEMALVYEGERFLALTWCCFVLFFFFFFFFFFCVDAIGANNGVEPLDDRDKK
jgi:hypothetical protein